MLAVVVVVVVVVEVVYITGIVSRPWCLSAMEGGNEEDMIARLQDVLRFALCVGNGKQEQNAQGNK